MSPVGNTALTRGRVISYEGFGAFIQSSSPDRGIRSTGELDGLAEAVDSFCPINDHDRNKPLSTIKRLSAVGVPGCQFLKLA